VKCLHLPEWDATLRYHDLPGAGPPVVFLHGLGAASSLDLVGMAARPPLSRHRRLLVDLLGFGYSDRPAGFSYSLEGHARSVAAALDEAGARGCWVIGHSMGGTVGIVLAGLRPDLVSALVVAEGNLDPGVGGASVEIARMPEEEYVARGHDALRRRFAEAAGPADPGLDAYLGAFGLADRLAVHRSAVGLLAPIDPTARERLYRFPGPKAFVFGERSLPDPDQERLAADGVEVIVIPGAGHSMTVEAPDALARLVGGFLERAAP
jgi:pimeloyl-ACP methyl ester carboxylesterase